MRDISHHVDSVCSGMETTKLIPPDLAKKLLNRDFSNLAQRVHRGGNLSRSERAMLHGMATASLPTATLAENYVELAKILRVTRRTIQNWRKRSDAPKPDANGFHDVAAWREFMRRAKLAGHCSDEEAALRLRRLQAETEEREMRLADRKAAYVSVAEVKKEWCEMTARVARVLRQKFEVELPPLLMGYGAADIQTMNQRAIDEAMTMLHEGK